MSVKSNKIEVSEELWLCGEKNSHGRCSVKQTFLEISKNSQEHIPVQSLFFNKVAGLVKFLRTPFLTEHLRVTAFFMFLIIHIYNDMKIKLTKRN